MGNLRGARYLRQCTRRCREARSRLRLEREADPTDKLKTALRTNRVDPAWRVCFEMAGNGLRPRKRNIYVFPDSQPDLQTWTEDLALAGGEGGLEAER
eukprot:7112637-Pyramimonas_sp.AAC.1